MQKIVLNSRLLFNLLLFVYPQKYLEGCKVFTKLLMNSGWNNFAQDKCFSNIYYLFFFIFFPFPSASAVLSGSRSNSKWLVVCLAKRRVSSNLSPKIIRRAQGSRRYPAPGSQQFYHPPVLAASQWLRPLQRDEGSSCGPFSLLPRSRKKGAAKSLAVAP